MKPMSLAPNILVFRYGLKRSAQSKVNELLCLSQRRVFVPYADFEAYRRKRAAAAYAETVLNKAEAA